MRHRWHVHNGFTLLPESKRFLPAMFTAIEQAEHYVFVELYLMESGTLADRVIDALTQAARRGVHVALLLDGYGAMGLSSADRWRLHEGGVALRFFNPLGFHSLARNLSRDHRKIMLVDGRMAFVGGFGAVDAFLNAWYEIAVRAEGPVVTDWETLFRRLWNSRMTRDYLIDKPAMTLPSSQVDTQRLMGEMRGRAMDGQGYRYQAIRRSLYHRVKGATTRLWLCTAYFVPTFTLRRRLVQAARRGVDVRLLLPGSENDHPGVRYASQRFYHVLLKAGVRIFEFQPSFIHAKFVLADNWSSIGSCNFDHWNLHWNLEANQEIDDAQFAEQVRELFERNFATSDEVNAAAWAARPWGQRAKEWLFGTLDGWVTRLK
jgi:phosphatidylserine/phosphatidylglycerophosphate/cardiolipin synthase-like enzyme